MFTDFYKRVENVSKKRDFRIYIELWEPNGTYGNLWELKQTICNEEKLNDLNDRIEEIIQKSA